MLLFYYWIILTHNSQQIIRWAGLLTCKTAGKTSGDFVGWKWKYSKK